MPSFSASGTSVSTVMLPTLLLLTTASTPAPQRHCAIDPSLPARLRLASVDASVEVSTTPFALELRDRDGRVVLASTGAGALGWTSGRVAYDSIVSPGYTRFTAALDPWHEGLRVAQARATADALELTLVEPDAPASPCVHARVLLRGATLRVEARLDATATARQVPRAWEVAFASPADEGFLGLGERFNRTDQRGHQVHSWVEEGGIGTGEGQRAGAHNPYPSGEEMTYYPVPFFVSTRGYGFWLDTTWRSQLDLASTRDDAWRAWHVGPTLAFEVFVPRAGDVRPWPYQIIDGFTAATGRPMVPPPWALGPRRRINRHARVEGVAEIQAMRDADLAVTSIDDALHFLPHGSHLGHEAELAAWTADARGLGYRVNGYFNSMVSVDPAAATAAFAAEGVTEGAFLRRADGSFPGVWVMTGHRVRSLYVVDFTSAAASAWFVRAFDWAFALGYSGFMYDFGEYALPDVVARSGMSGEELHNLYPVLQARAAHQALERGAHAGDWLAFMRSGYTGSSAFVPMAWSGDPSASFEDSDGLPSVVRAGINVGVSGVPSWGSDIGGYHCLVDGVQAADEELLVRWIQMGALMPGMQDQDACEGSDASKKASIWRSQAARDAWRCYARLHTRLFPYWYTLLREAHATGAPVTRHMFLEHPERPDLRGVDDVFYAGPALLVAPVLARGARSKRVVLPDARYLDWDTRKIVHGGALEATTLDAPLERMPLLLRAGHILPLLDESIDTLVPTDAPGIVDAADVGDVYDVVVLLEPNQPAAMTLFDGTLLEARWDGTPSAPTVRLDAAPGQHLDAPGLQLTNTGPRRVRWQVYLAD